MESGVFQSIVDRLSIEIGRELRYRDIPSVLGGKTGGQHQVYLLAPWGQKDLVNSGSIENFTTAFIRKWAIELGIKLARPFELTTYELELPGGLLDAAVSSQGHVWVRGCISYDINTDQNLVRFDVLASWKE